MDSHEGTRTDSKAQHRLPPLTPRRPDVAQAELREAYQDAFLAEYAALGTITHAAKAARISPQAHYLWLDDPRYVERWEAAQVAYVERLEREADRRAVEGTEKGVYYQGERVDTERQYSDTLLLALLKARRPEVYKDRTELTGAGGGPVQVQAVRADALARLTPEELAVLLRLNPGMAPRALPDGSQAQPEAALDAEAEAVGVDRPAQAEPGQGPAGGGSEPEDG